MQSAAERETEGTDEEEEEEEEEELSGLFSMPGNFCPSTGQRVEGSSRPPRHWRTKANAARVSGRTVRRRRRREAKLGFEKDGRRGAERPAMGNE